MRKWCSENPGLTADNLENAFRNGNVVDKFCRPLARCISVPSGSKTPDDVFQHTIRCLRGAAKLGFNDDFILTAAIVLHDVGKPTTQAYEVNGELTFHRHDVQSALIAYEWMRQAYPNLYSERVTISKIVKNHMFRLEANPSENSIRRWMCKSGKACWQRLINLRLADRLGNLTLQNEPLITPPIKAIMNISERLLKTGLPIFTDDLVVLPGDLTAEGMDYKVTEEFMQNIVAACFYDRNKNNKTYILSKAREFIERSNTQSKISSGHATNHI